MSDDPDKPLERRSVTRVRVAEVWFGDTSYAVDPPLVEDASDAEIAKARLRSRVADEFPDREATAITWIVIHDDQRPEGN